MPKIQTAGRTDVEAFFKKSSIFETERLDHHPLLAFVETDDTIRVQIINKPRELLSFPDETPVMGQWSGDFRSDYFQFTVGQYRQYKAEKNKVLLTAKNIVKRVGKRGGFRSLTYEYTREEGGTSYGSAYSSSHAEELETFFKEYNIPVRVVVES